MLQWVETRDTTKLPPMHRAAPATKNYPAHNVRSAEVEKPCTEGHLGT